MSHPESSYEALGGARGIRRLVDALEMMLLDDCETAGYYLATPFLRHHMTILLCQVTGGTEQYDGADLRQVHARVTRPGNPEVGEPERVPITARAYDRFVYHFTQALWHQGAPVDLVERLSMAVRNKKDQFLPLPEEAR